MASYLDIQRAVFRTPVGTFDSYIDAHDACMRCDLDPVECIWPDVTPRLISEITEYGTTVRLSQPILVF